MRFFVLALGALLAAVSPASAVLTERSCDDPAVFGAAAVNVVVLPYQYVGGSAPPETGDRLSFLVQLDTFFSIVKFGGVHVVRLLKSEGSCEPDRVFARLLGGERFNANEVRRKKALVILWGRIFEHGDDIFVQSYLRFARKGMTEDIEFRVEGKTFRGKAPFDILSFAPRKISRSDLEEIGREFQASQVIRDVPDESAPARPLSLRPGPNLVSEMQEGWIKILGDEASSGWIRARPESWSLSKLLPELTFVEGLVGYLRYQVGALSLMEGLLDRMKNSVARRNLLQTAGEAASALRSYRDREDATIAEQAVAMSEILEGFCGLAQPAGKAAVCRTDTWRHFRNAADLAPYSGDARNLEVIAHVCLAYQGEAPGLKQAEVADTLLQAAILEPDDAQLLDNLLVLYQVFQRPPPGNDPAGAMSASDLRSRLEVARQVKKDLAESEPALP